MNANSTTAPAPAPPRNARLLSDTQAEICCTRDDESMLSSSGSTGGRRARDDRDVAADFDDQHLRACGQRLVVVGLREQVEVAGAGNRHPHLAALAARDRKEHSLLAPHQRGGVRNL